MSFRKLPAKRKEVTIRTTVGNKHRILSHIPIGRLNFMRSMVFSIVLSRNLSVTH